MRFVIQARLDDRSRKRLAVLVRELGWTPSRVVREGLRALEASYLRRKKPGIIGLVKFKSAAGIFQVPFQLPIETAAVKQLLRKYKDRKIDLADACLIRLADLFGTADILTLNRDFAIYRWGKNKPFRLLPSG